jgi:drug/metabolite transporter (DMT)-like permease
MALMTAAMACYVLNDTCVKLTTHSLAAGQVLALRGIGATMMVAAVALRSVRREDLRAILRPIVALRCSLEVTTAALSVAALSLASLGLVTAITMAAPVIIGLGAVALGWEPLRGRRVAAVLAGFAGVLLVVRPSAEGEGAWGAGFALLCAASLAARDLVTRRLPPGIPSAVIALLTTVSVALAGLALSLAQAWRPLQGTDALLLLAAALFTAFGNYAVVAACRGPDLAVVTPFRYTNILWALLLGYFVWGELPDLRAVAGIGLIAASSIVSMHASRKG